MEQPITEEIAKSLAIRAAIRFLQGDVDSAIKDLNIAIVWGEQNNFPEINIWKDNKTFYETNMPKPKEIKLHDYTSLRWGWSYNFISGGKDWFSAIGWGEDLNVGDQIVVILRKTIRIRYWIRDIKYKSDPRDMWEARFERVDEPDNPQEPN